MLMIVLRIIALSIFTFFCCLLVILFYSFLPKQYQVYFAKFWANGTLFCLGITIRVEGKPTDYVQKNTMVIANHISWIDIPILYTQHLAQFVSRAEIKEWPILSLLIKSGSAAFINRRQKHSLNQAISILHKRLQSGATIGFFPEGKTGKGLEVMPFKPALFEAGILANSTIIPLVIQYYTKDGKLTSATTYANEINFWQCLISSLKLNGILVKVTSLQQVRASEFSSRKELSQYLHKKISDQYQTNWDLDPQIEPVLIPVKIKLE